MKKEIVINDSKYETSKYKYDFQKLQTIRSFGNNIYDSKVTISEPDQKQSSLLNVILDFDNKAKPRSKADKKKKTILMKG